MKLPLQSVFAHVVIGLFLCNTHLVLAQVGVEVTAVDANTGQSVKGIVIELHNIDTGDKDTAVTEEGGRVRFGGLSTTGRWQVRSAAQIPYQAAESTALRLRTNYTQTVRLVLARSTTAVEEVVITGSRAISHINRINSEVSSTITALELASIPIEGRSLDRVLLRLPNVTQATGFFNEAPAVAINGANSLFSNYMIDGLDNNENFLGGQRFPIAIGMVQDITVLASNYSAEFGRTANGVVNVTTRSGSNDYIGDVFLVSRPGGFLSAGSEFNRNDLSGNPVSEDFERYQGGFSLGGPIVKDRSFFFANLEYTRDETDNQLSAPLLGVAETLPGINETLLATVRLDHRFNEQWSGSLRINHGRATIESQGGGLSGGVTFPSAGSAQDRFSTNVAGTVTYRGDTVDYSGALQYSRFEWDFGEALNGPGPQVTVLDASGQTAAVIGHPGFIFDERENTVQTQHKISFDWGKHRIKLGTDIVHVDFKLTGGGNINGNYRVQLNDAQLANLAAAGIGAGLNITDLPLDAQLLDYSVELQPNAFGTTQSLYSLFVEDEYGLTEDLTLTLGVRWDYDTLSKAGNTKGDTDNIAPRASVNWSFRDNMVLRGGAGVFYEKIPYAVISDAIQRSSTAAGFTGQLQSLVDQGILPADTDIERITRDGNLSVNPVDQCNAFLDCPNAQSLGALRDQQTSNELRVLNPNGLDNPYAVQLTIGYQWQINNVFSLGVDTIYSEGHNQIRLIDVNAPAPFRFNQVLFEQLGADAVAAMSAQQRESLGLIRSQAAADATRPALINGNIPLGGARAIIMSDSGGRSRYRALNLNLIKAQQSDNYDFRLSYTLSRLENNTDDINFRANDANNYSADWGPSLNDRTHAISAIVNYYPIDSLTLTLAALLQSGQPINYVPDATVFGTTDLNGDGLGFASQFTGNPDRYPGNSRNSGRLPWSSTFDLGLQYQFTILSNTLFARADFFNVFDTNNESGYPVNYTASNQIQLGGDAAFEQRSAAAPRTFQFSLQYIL